MIIWATPYDCDRLFTPETMTGLFRPPRDAHAASAAFLAALASVEAPAGEERNPEVVGTQGRSRKNQLSYNPTFFGTPFFPI